MPHTALSPAIDHPTEPNAPTAKLSFEECLALIDTAMTVRLDETKVACEVDTALIPTEPVDPGDVVDVPLTPPLQPPPNLYTSRVAALLQRAHHRPTTEGWCNEP